MRIFATRFVQTAAVLAVLCGSTLAAAAQDVNPQPATGNPQQGVLGSYYNTPTTPPVPIGSPAGAATPGLVRVAQRVDAGINLPNPEDAGRPTGQGTDNFTITWLGTITIPLSGKYHFRAYCDDGGRFWISKTLPFAAAPNSDPQYWKDQPPQDIFWPRDNNAAGIDYVAGDVLYFRMEMYENGGGSTAQFFWRTEPATAWTIVPASAFMTPGPCPTPVVTAQSVGGAGQVQLDWGGTPAATATQTPASSYNIFRSAANTSGGPYTWIGNSATTSFLDAGPLVFGSTYYYVVQGVYSAGTFNVLTPAFTNTNPRGEVAGAASPQIGCLVNPFAISPASQFITEAGGTGNIRITTSAPIPNGLDVTFNIAMSVPGGGTPFLFTSPVTITGNNTPGQFVEFTVTGNRDNVANNPKTATFTVGPSQSSNPLWAGHTLPPVTCTHIESDIAGVIIETIPPGGTLAITNGGPPVSFNVRLATIPDYDVTLDLGSTLPYAAVISPTPITFLKGTQGPITVTLTPNNNDTSTTYLTSFYVTFSVTSQDYNYNGINPGSAYVFMPTSTPPINEVWGSGGCGLLGLEGVLIMGLIAGLRRRRAA